MTDYHIYLISWPEKIAEQRDATCADEDALTIALPLVEVWDGTRRAADHVFTRWH